MYVGWPRLPVPRRIVSVSSTAARLRTCLSTQVQSEI